jgi:hypothetical protein
MALAWITLFKLGLRAEMKHCKEMNASKKESNTQCTNGGGKKCCEGCYLVTCHNLFPFRPLQVKLYFENLVNINNGVYLLYSTDFVTDALG